MTQDEQIEIYKDQHDKLQKGLPSNQMAIREGIVINVGLEDYPRFGYEFFCFRSPEMKLEMDAFIKYAKDKKCFLDIGAFDGIFSVVFSELNKAGITYAFEPYPEQYGKLCFNSANRNVLCYQAALSENSGKIELFESGGHLNSNKTSEEQKSVWCNAITGDAFCFGCFPNIAPDVIKIDVEGAELNVLRGLVNVISKHFPLIFLELHYGALSTKDIVDIMEIIGWYKYTIIDMETGLEIPLSSLMYNKGEKRILLK